MSQTVAAQVPAAVDYERTLVLAIEVSSKSWVEPVAEIWTGR